MDLSQSPGQSCEPTSRPRPGNCDLTCLHRDPTLGSGAACCFGAAVIFESSQLTEGTVGDCVGSPAWLSGLQEAWLLPAEPQALREGLVGAA